jgi:hypothetical protein
MAILNMEVACSLLIEAHLQIAAHPNGLKDLGCAFDRDQEIMQSCEMAWPIVKRT